MMDRQQPIDLHASSGRGRFLRLALPLQRAALLSIIVLGASGRSQASAADTTAIAATAGTPPAVRSDLSPADLDPLTALNRLLQTKVVKIFGAGGFGGLESYQSGFFVSDQGHVVTSWSTVLDVAEIRVLTADGKRHDASIVGSDPQCEIAVLKLDIEGNEYFRLEAISPPPGTRVFALSNLFKIATGDERSSLQKGVVMAVAPLAARRGRLRTLYQGPVVVIDAMTNNPGATGGVVVDLAGRAVGMLGKELRDEQAGIYINYALPAEAVAGSVKRILSGEVIVADRQQIKSTRDPHSLENIGVVLVPDVLPKTPPFVDRVIEGSIAQRSGLAPNDLVLLLNNQRIDSQATLRELLTAINRNDPSSLLVQRGQELITVQVKP